MGALLLQFWEAALKLGAEAMLDGMGQIRKCSQEGRAAMSLDLSAVEKGLRPLAPPSALSSLRRVRMLVCGKLLVQTCVLELLPGTGATLVKLASPCVYV